MISEWLPVIIAMLVVFIAAGYMRGGDDGSI